MKHEAPEVSGVWGRIREGLGSGRPDRREILCMVKSKVLKGIPVETHLGGEGQD